VPAPTYRLKPTSIPTLRELLEQVRCPIRSIGGKRSWDRSWLERNTGLTTESVRKIVQAVDPWLDEESQFTNTSRLTIPVEERTLVKLFIELYRLTGVTRSESEIQKSRLWEENENIQTSSHPDELVVLLEDLDYVNQSNVFTNRISQNYAPMAFLIPAPCISTQKWVIHRLAQKVNNNERAIRIAIANVESHPIGLGDIDRIWTVIGERLKVQGKDVIKHLSQATVNKPLIISLYNFGEDPILTPQHVIDEFWMPLVRQIPNRTARTRIVLLIADRYVPINDSDHVLSLPPLDEITQIQVEDWLGSTAVSKWCTGEWGAHWTRNLIDRGFPAREWPWDKPGQILNRLCVEFEMENGLQNLQKKWEW
jgi:inactive STAND